MIRQITGTALIYLFANPWHLPAIVLGWCGLCPLIHKLARCHLAEETS
jgi:coenzyme F420-reducing hydrogenase alpha subunit